DQRSADDAFVTTELSLPVVVAQHGDRRLAFARRVLETDQPPDRRPKVQDPKVPAGDQHTSTPARSVAGGDVRLEWAVMRGHAREDVLPCFELSKHRIAER